MFLHPFRGRSRPLVIATAAIALAIAGTSLALGASHMKPAIFGSVNYADDTNAPVIQGLQEGTGSGVEGVVGTSAGAIGILGFANVGTTADVGLEGDVIGPSSTGLYGQAQNTNIASPSVGLLGTSANGIGVEGESLLSTGVGTLGTAADGLSSGSLGIGSGAGALGTSARANFLDPGIDGESTVRGAQDTAGAFGLGEFLATKNTPDFGVLGYGNVTAVTGYTVGSGASQTTVGVEGSEITQPSPSFPDFDAGVLGLENYGTGIIAESGGATPNLGAFGAEPIGLIATSGTGSTGASESVAAFAEGADANTFSLAALNGSNDNEVDLVTPFGDLAAGFTGGSEVFNIDTSGNENIAGILTTSGPCSSGCVDQRTGKHERVITYAAQSSEPTVEDYGEGQVAGGVGHVTIDAAFGRTIDLTKNYMVFLTPEGDSRGLYVTQKTGSGFSVHENQGGRDSLAFSYRIVAKPYGATASRLPLVDLSQVGSRRATHGFAHHVSQPMEPYAALVKAVGQARAQQILAQFRAEFLSRLRMENRSPHVDSAGKLHLGSAVVAPPKS